jgi:UDP-glucose 4-epimerase
MGNDEDLARAFSEKVDAVMHFAALSLVGESVEKPALYFENNVSKGLKLLNAMLSSGVDKLIFSSTAAIYGEPSKSPITEDFPLIPTSPYGDSKLVFESMLKWYSGAYKMRYVSLRYFNAAGADGGCGEDHNPESHLIPLVLQVALGKRKKVTIFGDDYPTPDGTCIRDYIHVKDLADAHVKALEHLAVTGEDAIFNLGQGKGSSVREVIDVARKVTHHPIPADIGPRRAGDPSVLVASNELIQKVLGWSPKYSDLETIIGDAWSWHQAHPDGYIDDLKVKSSAL